MSKGHSHKPRIVGELRGNEWQFVLGVNGLQPFSKRPWKLKLDCEIAFESLQLCRPKFSPIQIWFGSTGREEHEPETNIFLLPIQSFCLIFLVIPRYNTAIKTATTSLQMPPPPANLEKNTKTHRCRLFQTLDTNCRWMYERMMRCEMSCVTELRGWRRKNRDDFCLIRVPCVRFRVTCMSLFLMLSQLRHKMKGASCVWTKEFPDRIRGTLNR